MKKGFTLIELLAAVLVIGVLSSIAVPQYYRSIERARMVEGIQLLPAFYESVQRWQVEHPTENWSEVGSLDLLDISTKGQLKKNEGSGTTNLLCTSNFVYFIETGNVVGPIAVATSRKGKYQGTTFVYMAQRGGETTVFCAPPDNLGYEDSTERSPDWQERVQRQRAAACSFTGYRVDDDGRPLYQNFKGDWVSPGTDVAELVLKMSQEGWANAQKC